MFYEDQDNLFDNAENNVQKAFSAYENGNINSAIDKLDKAIESDPCNPNWYFNKGLALDSVNRFEDAIEEYKQAEELSPYDLEILNCIAIDYTRTGQYDLAIAAFENIQSLNLDFEPSYCNRIITYTEMGKHDLAEQMFYLAQQINPDCPMCFYNIGNSLFVRQDYQRAISCWKKTASLEPTHPQINYRIAQAYWSMENYDGTRQYFLRELRFNPGDTDVILDFGIFLLQVGDIDSAKEKFNRILEFDPHSASAYFYLGEIALNNSNLDEAERLFSEAAIKDKAMPGPYFRLARCAIMNNRPAQAREYILCELEKQIPDAEVLISIASMSLSLNEIDIASHCLLQAVDIDPENPDIYYYMGLLNIANNNPTAAAESFDRCLKLDPDHSEAAKMLRSLNHPPAKI